MANYSCICFDINNSWKTYDELIHKLADIYHTYANYHSDCGGDVCCVCINTLINDGPNKLWRTNAKAADEKASEHKEWVFCMFGDMCMLLVGGMVSSSFGRVCVEKLCQLSVAFWRLGEYLRTSRLCCVKAIYDYCSENINVWLWRLLAKVCVINYSTCLEKCAEVCSIWFYCANNLFVGFKIET